MLCLLLFVCGIIVSAQEPLLKSEYSYRRYTSHDGLHHLLTNTVSQDQSVFLWIGTMKGFARFDGYNFTPFLSETMQSIYRIEDAGDGQVRAYSEGNCFIVDNNDAIREIHLTDSLVINGYSSQVLPTGYLIYESFVHWA